MIVFFLEQISVEFEHKRNHELSNEQALHGRCNVTLSFPLVPLHSEYIWVSYIWSWVCRLRGQVRSYKDIMMTTTGEIKPHVSFQAKSISILCPLWEGHSQHLRSKYIFNMHELMILPMKVMKRRMVGSFLYGDYVCVTILDPPCN